jgi:hypothetical protein
MKLRITLNSNLAIGICVTHWKQTNKTMSKLGANFEIPSSTMPEAFGVNEERAEVLSEVMRNACRNAVERHGKAEDTNLDHVLSDIMREVDSKLELNDGERDMMLLQLGGNLGFLREAIGDIRGFRGFKEAISNLSEEERKELEAQHRKFLALSGSLASLIVNHLNDGPPDHDFSDN